jgi:hypothetical protein
VTGRRGRRCWKLLDDLKERRGYLHLKEEALDRTVWRAGFGRGVGLVVRQTANMNERTASFNKPYFKKLRKERIEEKSSTKLSL